MGDFQICIDIFARQTIEKMGGKMSWHAPAQCEERWPSDPHRLTAERAALSARDLLVIGVGSTKWASGGKVYYGNFWEELQ